MIRHPENFKPPSLLSFNGKMDPQEHIIDINNQMAIVGALDSLKCKNMVETKEEGVRHKKKYFKSGHRDRPVKRPSRCQLKKSRSTRQ